MENRPNASDPPDHLISRLVVLLFIAGLFVLSYYAGHVLRLPFSFWRSGGTTCVAPPPPHAALPPLPGAGHAVVQRPAPYVIVERMPELLGGLAALQRRVHYPEAARQAGVEGRVIVQFVVDEHGRVADPVVLRGIGAGCDEAALRAVTAARFRPGYQRGEAVPVRLTLPITFRLPHQG